MGTADNKTVLQRIFDDVINGKDLQLADELYAAELELHPDIGIGRGPARDEEGFRGS